MTDENTSTTPSVDMERAEAAKVHSALCRAVNTGETVPCEVYGVVIGVEPSDADKCIQDIIERKLG